MKIRDLIEKLKTFDPDMTVIVDYDGYEHVDMSIEEITLWGTGFKAEALKIHPVWAEPEPTIIDFDQKFLSKSDPPKPVTPRQGLFAELVAKEYQQIISESLERGTVFLVNKENLPKDGVIEFKVHNEREKNEGS
ncbi:hypothetical protein SEA_CASSEROLE_34 [Arthrobacter phage Casserole]|nr:hypothetical protein SEA_CASSEROLE_34 [Arthrobacter phage Casserole]